MRLTPRLAQLAEAHATEWAKSVEQVLEEELRAAADAVKDPDFHEFVDSTEVETKRRGLLFDQKSA